MSTADFNFEIFYVFFVYGLAFFSMGLVLMLESGRSPQLAEARVLRSLAFFGLVHGSHEWIEVLLLVRGWLGLKTPPYVAELRLFLLIISFIALLNYSLRALGKTAQRRLTFLAIPPGLLITYLVIMVILNLNQPGRFPDVVQHTDALARYFLAIPAALLAGLALKQQAEQARSANRMQLFYGLRLAAVGFGLYGLSQIVVTPVDFFPGNLLNSNLFHNWTGIPVQAIRALMAVAITLGLIRATQVVAAERQQAFVAAQQARVDALEQIQRDLVERETLRRELLRHTVIAQEDERARIARELHDETSQFITAMSLDLATLRNIVVRKPESKALLDRLQLLSRKMSDGIYRMVRDLRPAQLDDLGLSAALQYLADQARHEGVDMSIHIEGARQRLDSLVETVFFRVAQEAVTNVIRHALCTQAEILLRFSDTQVTLLIKDDGQGFDHNRPYKPPRGWGLEGMRERADSVEGDLQIISQPGHGTQIQLTIPVLNDRLRNKKETVYENDPIDAGR